MKHNNNLVKAKSEVIDVQVKNSANEDLGKICDIMLDKFSGEVAYAVMESGTFLGLGGKLFAIPWNALNYDPNMECLILHGENGRLKDAPGFDKNNWPDMADRMWSESISQYYGAFEEKGDRLKNLIKEESSAKWS